MKRGYKIGGIILLVIFVLATILSGFSGVVKNFNDKNDDHIITIAEHKFSNDDFYKFMKGRSVFDDEVENLKAYTQMYFQMFIIYKKFELMAYDLGIKISDEIVKKELQRKIEKYNDEQKTGDIKHNAIDKDIKEFTNDDLVAKLAQVDLKHIEYIEYLRSDIIAKIMQSVVLNRNDFSEVNKIPEINYQDKFPNFFDKMLKYDYGSRYIKYIEYDVERTLLPKNIEKKDIEKYYNEHKNEYIQPEYRKGKYIDLYLKDFKLSYQATAREVQEEISNQYLNRNFDLEYWLFDDQKTASEAFTTIKTSVKDAKDKYKSSYHDFKNKTFDKIPGDFRNILFAMTNGQFRIKAASDKKIYIIHLINKDKIFKVDDKNKIYIDVASQIIEEKNHNFLNEKIDQIQSLIKGGEIKTFDDIKHQLKLNNDINIKNIDYFTIDNPNSVEFSIRFKNGTRDNERKLVDEGLTFFDNKDAKKDDFNAMLYGNKIVIANLGDIIASAPKSLDIIYNKIKDKVIRETKQKIVENKILSLKKEDFKKMTYRVYQPFYNGLNVKIKLDDKILQKILADDIKVGDIYSYSYGNKVYAIYFIKIDQNEKFNKNNINELNTQINQKVYGLMEQEIMTNLFKDIK
ncbi:MAG: hypothetical protein OEY79_01695 [Anaplasmataceae bacterium]|nr:hypothetical protein [Anaplasmataceae bacterium]